MAATLRSRCRPFAPTLAILLLAAIAPPIPGREPASDRPSNSTGQHAAALIAKAWPARVALEQLPIGVFDSGTGGLAVLEEILKLDAFSNSTHLSTSGGDRRPDFDHERFVFLADQANMPYGNYPACARTGLLRELALCDTAFLLSAQSFPRSPDWPTHDKPPVKAVVIACNTATAYAKNDLDNLVARARLPVRILGVIDAAAEGALQSLGPTGTIGVLATQGTVASGAYPRAFHSVTRRRGLAGPIRVFQQGSLGLAGAIDSAPELIAPGATKPRPDYRGPSLDNPRARIDRRLLARYVFDFSAGHALYEGDPQHPTVLQLNSVENYVAYDVVSLLESVRSQPDAPPLAVIVLGCTHFPYVADQIRGQIQRLRDYQEEGRYVYRRQLAENVALVDPARLVARDLYRMLATEDKLAQSPPGQARAQFYITVPRPEQAGVAVDSAGWFTYEYKYGRPSGYTADDVRTVPLTTRRLDPPTADRLRQRAPTVWQLIEAFSR